MSSSQEVEVPLFATYQDAIDYWRNLALMYKEKYAECLKVIESWDHSGKRPSTVFEQNNANSDKTRDPFDATVLHEYIHPYILQHFSVSDLLKISEVSPNWFELTKTQKVEDKVELKLEKFLAVPPSILRDYKTVTWRLLFSLGNTEKFLPVFQRFSDSVETLKIDSTVAGLFDPPENNFAKLKCLHMSHLPDELEKFIVRGVRNAGNQLEELKYSDSGYREAQYCDMDFIADQKNLKRLDMADSDSLSDLWFPRSQLEYLHEFGIYPRDLSTCLEYLSLRLNNSEVLNNIMTRLPNLTGLEIGNLLVYHQSLDEFEDVAMNSSILSLKFLNDYEFPDYIIRRILLALPELKTLEFGGSITANMIEFIANNLMKLETLLYVAAEDGAIERYETMKIEQPEITNMNIQAILSV